MLFIDNDTVSKVLSMSDCIDAQDTAFRGLPTGASVHRPRIDVYVPTERTDAYYRWGTMEGASKDLGVFAIRMKSDILHWPTDEQGNWREDKYNTEPGLYCGLVFLFSTKNAAPLAMINDGIIQHMRVGGGAGLGAKYLSREDSHTVGMIGSGGMARTYLQAFCSVRDIRTVNVFSPTKKNREAFAAEMSAKLEIEITPVDRPQDAVDGADIVDSGLILIQAMTEDRPYGFRSEGGTITDLGSAPFGVLEIDASVRLPVAAEAFEAVVLGPNGYDSGRRIELHADKAGSRVELPRDALYTVLLRVAGR